MSPTKNLSTAAFCPLLYLLCCAALAALSAYPIFGLTGSEDARFFRSLVSRGGQVFLILGLYPVARRLGLKLTDLGLRRDFPRQLGVGLGLGASMLFLHTLSLLALNVRGINVDAFTDAGRLFFILAKALGIGAAVALLEETLFRGVLFAAIRKFSNAALAVTISALYYALLHFIGTRWTPELAEIGWATGFRVAALGLSQVANLQGDSFLALFLAGVLLGCVRARIPGGLGYCMGLHAGWVFIIKATKSLTHMMPNTELGFLVSRYDRVIGNFSSVWMAILILAFLIVTRHLAERDPPIARNR